MKGIIKVNGRQYEVEVKDGVTYIDGKTVDEFMHSLDFETLLQFAVVGKAVSDDEAAIRKEKRKRKYSHDKYKQGLAKYIKRSPQKMMDELYQAKNN